MTTPTFPSFFKPLVLEDYSTTLRVPPDFLINFNGKLPKHTTLRSSFTEKSWDVLMKITDHGLYFSRGWSKFVTDHAIKYGDFLVFNLISTSTFGVLIYGHNACEKYFPKSVVKKSNCQRKKEQPTVVATPTLLPNAQPADVDNVEPANVVIKNANRKNKMTKPKRAAVDHIKPTSNLHFVRAITSFRMLTEIWIPQTFAQETGLWSKLEVTVKYISEGGGDDGTEWPVRIRAQTVGRFRLGLSTGWLKFCKEKTISVGDSIMIEFVDGCLHVTDLSNRVDG
ncbi:hypothetical protein ACFE04_022411 [Oxalis oulophora]